MEKPQKKKYEKPKIKIIRIIPAAGDAVDYFIGEKCHV